MNLLVACIGSAVFALLLAIAGVNFMMWAFWPLLLMYLLVQAVALNSIFEDWR